MTEIAPLEIDDDAAVGHVLLRREVLALMGATGVVACAPSALSGQP